MNPTAWQILVVLSILFAVLSMIKPAWPLLSVSVLLLAIAVLIGKST